MKNRRYAMKMAACSLLLLQTGLVALSQDLTDLHWRFGNTAQALDFNKGDFEPIVVSDQATPFGLSGGATISDPLSGNLLFYTDGLNLYNGSNRITPNGSGLNGSASINQAAVACPVPGVDTQFYIFTNPGSSGEVRFTVVDTGLQGNAPAGAPPLGDAGAQKNMSTGLTSPADALAIIPGPNRRIFWLLTQNTSDGSYKVMEVSAANFGAITTFDFATPTNPAFEAAAFGVFSFQPDSVIIAVAPKTANRNIQILRFDATTGTLSFERQLGNTGVDDENRENFYDAEWSGNGTRLYYSQRGGNNALTGKIYQFDFDSLKTSTRVAGNFFRSFGLKRGPDGSIYHLYQAVNGGPVSIGRFAQPDSLPEAVEYEPQIAGFGKDAAARQFPATSPPREVVFNMTFNILGACQKSPVLFSPSIQPTPQSVSWDFGDGGTSNEYAPIYPYQEAGMFTVTLTATLNGQSQTSTQVVNIIPNELQLNLNDTTICPGEKLKRDALPSGKQGSFQYQWSTGETTQMIEIDSAGVFWVKVTDLASGGCSAFASFTVTVYGNRESAANVWYFGQKAGIDFNKMPPAPITDANLMDSPEGCATISDRNGDLLFYTNGSTVWNKKHKIMLNGTKIGGDSTSAQSSLILPVPENETLFYIITTDPIHGDRTYDMRFSVVDMTEDTARGSVVIKDRPLFTKSTEKIAASGTGGATTWLLAHEYGNNNYRSYPITATGIGNATVTSVGKSLTFAEELHGRGTMKISSDGNLAGSVIPGPQNLVELVTFIDSTGAFTSPLLLDLEAPAPSEVYGIEFSSGGARLYVTLTGAGSRLIQYNLDSLLNASRKYGNDTVVQFINKSKTEISAGTGYGSLQLGPDQIIYMARDNNVRLGTISNSNGDGTNVGFSDDPGFDLAGRTSRLGLPNFAQQFLTPPQEPSISVGPACLGQPVRLSATGTSDIDKFTWKLPDGTILTAPDTMHIFKSAGTFNVILNITNRCGFDTTLTRQVIVNPTPEKPQLPTAIGICDDNGVSLIAWPENNANLFYTWSTGETSREITVKKPGTITAFITTAAGCISDTVTTLVGERRPIIDLGADKAICQGEMPDPLDAKNPGATYSWAINGAGTGNTSRFQNIDASAPGNYEYVVSITDVNGCDTKDSIVFTIPEAPVATVNPTPSSGCLTADGKILLNVVSRGSFSYQVSGPSLPTPLSKSADGPFDDSIEGLKAGTYLVRVTNNVTGCTTTFGAVSIDSKAALFNIDTATPKPGCEKGTVTFTTNMALDYAYRLVSSSSGTQETLGNVTGTGPHTSALVPLGTYTLEVTSISDGCIRSQADLAIEQAPKASFTFEPVQTDCGNEGTISVTPVGAATTFTWAGPGIIAGQNTGESITVTSGGIYSVTGSEAGICDQTDSIEFFLTKEPKGIITISGDPCEGELTLTASLTDGENPADYLFNWSNGASTLFTVVNQSGDYSVTIRNKNSGCLATIDTVARVDNILEVTLLQQPNCGSKSQVTLVAQSNTPAQVHFQWTGPQSTILPDTTSTVLTGLSGTYQVTVNGINNKCQASDKLNVNVIPIADTEIVLPPAVDFCSKDPANGSVELTPGIFNTYEWQKLPGRNIISQQSSLVTSQPGTYVVAFSNGSTCRSARVVVTDDCRPKVYVPNAFSPNGNGQNEEFFAFKNPYVTDFIIFIFNRWGEMVYQSNSIDFRWNGTLGSKPLPVGAYAYLMRFKSNLDASGKEYEQRGMITLVK